MEIEVVVRVPPAGDFFNFDSPSSAHYLTAPSTPRRRFVSSFISAPNSPSSHADNAPIGSPSAVPFHWEEKPGFPKSPESKRTSGEGDFEFDFSGQFSDKASLSADELFHGGKIKPLKPPPGFQFNDLNSNMSSPRSPHYSILSPRNKNDIDPFEAALIKETGSQLSCQSNEFSPHNRGRRHTISFLSSSFVRKGTRSLAPFRISGTERDEDDEDDGDSSLSATAIKAKSATITTTNSKSSTSSSSSFLSSISFSKGNRKWRFRDLFRSASEGRATDEIEKEERLRKYAVMSKKVDDGVKKSSFQFSDSIRTEPLASADEMRYTGNAADSEEMKKKTSQPYKLGLFGCLGLNRPGMQEFSRSLGSLTRG